MHKPPAELKVYVSDKIVDLQRSIEDKQAVYRTSFQRTRSQNELNIKGVRKDLEQKVPLLESYDNFETIPRPLFASIPNSQKFRKPKPRIRSRTVDPRFRRSRSPPLQLSASGLAKTASNTPMVQTQDKQTSSSSPNVLQKHANTDTDYVNTNEEILVKQNPKLDTDQEKQIILQNEAESEASSEKSYNTPYNTQTKSRCSSKKDNCGKDENCQTHPGGSSIEEIRSPYWYDDRVLKKYNNILQPVRHQNLSNLLHPLKRVSASDCIASYNCQNYQFPSYNYDDATEIGNYSILHGKEPPMEDKQATEASAIPYMMLGCLIGIVLATSLSWMATQYLDWGVSKMVKLEKYLQQSHNAESTVLSVVEYIGENIIYGVEKTIKTLIWILKTPRGDIFNKPDSEKDNEWNTWFKNLI